MYVCSIASKYINLSILPIFGMILRTILSKAPTVPREREREGEREREEERERERERER